MKFSEWSEGGSSGSDDPDVSVPHMGYIAAGMQCLATTLRPKIRKHLMWLLRTQIVATLEPWYAHNMA
jgi:hypothetical protein